jgi:hypothetical protein
VYGEVAPVCKGMNIAVEMFGRYASGWLVLRFFAEMETLETENDEKD